MSIKLYDSCDCLYEELNGSNYNQVKGYVLVQECSVCSAKRESENATRLAEKEALEASEAIKLQNKEAAKIKLLALGLSQDEINAIIG